MTKFDKINSEAIYELHYQEDMRAKGIPYQVSNLVIYTAISALEKQIPKKPIYEDIGNIYGALKRTCVNCGDVCMVSKCGIPFEHYCRYCGQKLNWSEEE